MTSSIFSPGDYANYTPQVSFEFNQVTLMQHEEAESEHINTQNAIATYQRAWEQVRFARDHPFQDAWTRGMANANIVHRNTKQCLRDIAGLLGRNGANLQGRCVASAIFVRGHLFSWKALLSAICALALLYIGLAYRRITAAV